MVNIANKILKDREKKDSIIKKYVDSYQVISLKANIPGNNKNIKEAYVLVNIFDKILIRYKPIKRLFYKDRYLFI